MTTDETAPRAAMPWHHRAALWVSMCSAALAIAFALVAIGQSLRAGSGADARVFSYSIPMAPSTAALIVVCGFTLIVDAWRKTSRVSRLVTLVTAAVTAGVAGFVLARNFLGAPAATLTTIAVTPAGSYDVPLGKMSPITAGLLMLLSLGMAAQALHGMYSRAVTEWVRHGAPAIGGCACAIVVLAYATGAPLFYASGIPVALATAVALGALNLGVLLLHGTPGVLVRTVFGADAIRSSSAISRSERRLFLIVTAALLIVLLAAAAWYLQEYRRRDLARLQRELTALVDFQAGQLVTWRAEQVRTAQLLSRAPNVVSILREPANTRRETAAADELRQWLRQVRSTELFVGIALFDTSAAPLVVEPANALANEGTAEVRAALQTNAIVIREFHGPSPRELHLDLIAPVGEELTAPPAGALLLQVDPEVFAFPLLRKWPTSNATGETMLVRREGADGILVSELRHRATPEGTRFPLADTRLLSARVLGGERGLMVDAVDNRGVPVVGVGRIIPDTTWALVTKLDQSEAYAPVRRHAFAVLLIVGAFGGAIVFAGGTLLRHRREQNLARELELERTREVLNQRLALVMEHANDAIFMFAEDGHILEANQRAAASYGYTVEELRALTVADLRSPAARETMDEQLKVADATPGGAMFETEHRRKDGTVFPVEVSSQVVEIEGQRLRLGVVRDIRQRREHETQIERLNLLYVAVSRINQAIVASKSRNELFASVCRALVDTGVIKMAWVGWTDAQTHQVVGLAQFGDVGGYLESVRVYADERPEGNGPTGIAIREGRAYVCNDFEADPVTLPWREAARRNGFLSSLSLPFSQGGRIVGAITAYAPAPHVFGPKEVALCKEAAMAVSFGLDQLEAEARQRETDERLRAAFETSPDGFVIWRRDDGRILAVNDRMVELYGYAREEMIGRDAVGLGMWVDPEARTVMLAELAARGHIDGMEVEARRKNGAIIHVSYAVRVLTTMPEPLIFGIVTDITEAKRAAEALRASEHRFRTLIENAPLAIAVGRNNRTMYVNEKYRELFRIAPGVEVVGRSLLDVWTPALRDAIEDRSRRRLGEERMVTECEGIACRSDGEEFPVHVALTTVQLPDGAAVVAFFVDLSEKWRAEEALRSSEERYRRMIETAQEGVYMYDQNWRLVFANQRFAEMLGYSREELLGHTLEDIILPRNLSVHEMRKARHVAGVADVFESAYRTKAGTVVWLRVSNSPIMERGVFTGCFGMAIDVSERRSTEQRMAEYQQRLHDLTQRLQQVREEECIRIARVVHDELGQQLTGLKMTLRSVETDLESIAGPGAGRTIDKVVSATELLDQTVNTVQRIAAELRPSLLDKLGLVAAIRHELDQLQQRLDLAFRFIGPDPGPQLPPDLAIACYRIVQEALTNVLRHSHARSVEVELRADSGSLVIEVRDDGCGIRPEALSDIHSIGLLGMQERALPFGGIVTIGPRKESGTVVRATFPQHGEPSPS